MLGLTKPFHASVIATSKICSNALVPRPQRRSVPGVANCDCGPNLSWDFQSSRRANSSWCDNAAAIDAPRRRRCKWSRSFRSLRVLLARENASQRASEMIHSFVAPSLSFLNASRYRVIVGWMWSTQICATAHESLPRNKSIMMRCCRRDVSRFSGSENPAARMA